MKYIKIYEEFKQEELTKEQMDWLDQATGRVMAEPRRWSLNSQGRVDVIKEVIVPQRYFASMKKFPVKFGHIKGNFSCNGCSALETLEGAPLEVDGSFRCHSCSMLDSLRGAPLIVKGDFGCMDCDSLTTLEGAPREVGKDFVASRCNNLKSLKGTPLIVGKNFVIAGCQSLLTLEWRPQKVGGEFYFSSCKKLKTLNGTPMTVVGKITGNDCSSLSPGEVELLKNQDLLKLCLSRGEKAEDFLHQKRGSIKGKEFGF